MQINVALNENNKHQAEQIRKARYPNTNAQQTRDAFIFNQCIDEFNDFPEVLIKYIDELEQYPKQQYPKQQRMLTIKTESNNRLKTLASTLNTSIAATYRSIIAYSIDKYGLGGEEVVEKIASNDIKSQQQIIEKIALLETEFAACNKTIREIKSLLKNREAD